MPTMPLNLLAFLSEWRLFEWRKGVPFRHLRPRRRHSHTARAYARKRSSPATRIPFFYKLLGWAPIVLSALSSINRAVFAVFRRFHRHSAGDFAKGLKSAVVARRNRLLTCNSETV